MSAVPQKYSVLLTDLYQLTMAYGYWKNRVQDNDGRQLLEQEFLDYLSGLRKKA